MAVLVPSCKAGGTTNAPTHRWAFACAAGAPATKGDCHTDIGSGMLNAAIAMLPGGMCWPCGVSSGVAVSVGVAVSDEFIAQAETRAEKLGSSLGVMAAIFYFMPFVITVLVVVGVPLIQTIAAP
jgi:hypothetical protein